MAARARWDKLRWQVVSDPPFSARELAEGTGRLRVGGRDMRILLLLLDRNFVATRQLFGEEIFGTRRRLSKRMARLYAVGLVARATVTAWDAQSGQPCGWEWVFALTRLGMEVLLLRAVPDAILVAGRWRPPHESESTRNNAIHEIAVGDLCLSFARLYNDDALQASVAADGQVPYIEAYWVGSRSLVQRVRHSVLHRVVQRDMISPDAAIVTTQDDEINVLFVEYEESARPDSLVNKLRGYAAYFEQRAWKRRFAGLLTPSVMISLQGAADRQGYYRNPYAQAIAYLRASTQTLFSLDGHVFFIREEEWRRADALWLEPLRPGAPIPVLDVMRPKPLIHARRG